MRRTFRSRKSWHASGASRPLQETDENEGVRQDRHVLLAALVVRLVLSNRLVLVHPKVEAVAAHRARSRTNKQYIFPR